MKLSLRTRVLAGFLSLLLALCSNQLLAADSTSKVNINSATATELADGLKGIGPSKAQAIVDYRQNHGPFSDIQQLTAVKGIGEKLVNMNQHVMTISPDSDIQ